MISVIIVSNNDAPVLARMFAPLISAAADGLVRDVILSDASTTDQARLIADAAGCTLLESAPGWRAQIEAGAKFACSEWLLCLKAGAIAQTGWMDEVTRFFERGDARERSGCFQVRYEEDGAGARFAEAKAWACRDVLKSPTPEHGLLTTKTKLQSGARGRSQLFRSALMYEFTRN
jgi:hypothetical protein